MIKTLRDAGVEAGITEVFNLDISVIESVKNFANKVKAKYPKINYAVNNGVLIK